VTGAFASKILNALDNVRAILGALNDEFQPPQRLFAVIGAHQ
jgi:hypothetical protein